MHRNDLNQIISFKALYNVLISKIPAIIANKNDLPWPECLGIHRLHRIFIRYLGQFAVHGLHVCVENMCF